MGQSFGKSVSNAFKIALYMLGPLVSNEMLQVTDIGKLNSNNDFNIRQELEQSKTYSLVRDDKNEVALRDNKGFRVLSFGELSEETVESLPNVLNVKEFMEKHEGECLKDKRQAFFCLDNGTKRGQMVFDDQTGQELYFEEGDGENLDYNVKGIVNFLALINTLTGGDLQVLDKEFDNDHTMVQLFNMEETLTASCTIKDALVQAFKMAGLDEAQIEEILNYKGADLEAEDVENSESADISNVEKEERVVYELKDASALQRSGDSNVYYITDEKLLKEASDENVLRMIEAELKDIDSVDPSIVSFGYDYEGFGTSEIITDQLQKFMKDGVMKGNDIDAFFTFTLAAKEGKGDRRQQRMARQTKKEVRNFLEENGYDLTKKSNVEQLKYLEDIQEELLVESISLDEEASKRELQLAQLQLTPARYNELYKVVEENRTKSNEALEKIAEAEMLTGRMKLAAIYEYTNKEMYKVNNIEQEDEAEEETNIKIEDSINEEDFMNGEPEELVDSDELPEASDVKIVAEGMEEQNNDIDVSLD